MSIPLLGVSGSTLRPDALSVDPKLMRHRVARLARTSQRALARDQGFTLVETLLAGVILLIVATGIAGVLTSSISANTVARERTNAEQCANDVVEQIRRKDYDAVGLVLGNPPGTVAATSACGAGLPATATVAISYVNDPTATSYATAANYKKVTVTVTRDRDGKQLARMVTFVVTRVACALRRHQQRHHQCDRLRSGHQPRLHGRRHGDARRRAEPDAERHD